MKEINIKSMSGILAALVAIALAILGLAFIWGLIADAVSIINIASDRQEAREAIWPIMQSVGILTLIALLITVLGFGLYMVEPNQSAVMSLFGKYVGTTHATGLRFNNPFLNANKISMRVRNFESGRMKVNDLGGSPIEIAAIVVWKVADSAEAVFNVDDYESFVQIQSEAAIRSMASSYPYDPKEEGDVSLRSHPTDVSERMKSEIQDRLNQAGIDVIEARISHLAYSPEIAQAMLQRQQAGAIIAARSRIVEGAVGMVESALESLKQKGVVDLDEERRAAMVSNLLVVLCSDRATQPVVNTGSIY